MKTCNGCTHDCNEGRLCESSRKATVHALEVFALMGLGVAAFALLCLAPLS